MRAQALERYWDAEKGGWREAGESFEATPERVAAINGAGFGELVRAEEAQAAPKAATRRRAGKEG